MKRSSGFVLREAGGEHLLVPVGAHRTVSNGVIVLNATGLYVWQLLECDRSEEELVAALKAHCVGPAADVAGDVRRFVEALGARGALS